MILPHHSRSQEALELCSCTERVPPNEFLTCCISNKHCGVRSNRVGSRHQVLLKPFSASKLALALAPGGCHPTGSKLTPSLASTARCAETARVPATRCS